MKISNAEFARRAGVSTRAVFNMEKAGKIPPATRVRGRIVRDSKDVPPPRPRFNKQGIAV